MATLYHAFLGYLLAHVRRPTVSLRICSDSDMHRCSAFLTFITFMLLSTNPAPSEDYRSPQLELWATFLGVSSALLAMFQYTPQIAHTWRIKHVGALSIPMMCIQTPGAVLMVLSIALRPGTNWTSMYLSSSV